MVTMREIAAELEVSTGTLYHYFDSKEAIFRALLEQLSQRDVDDAVNQLSEVQSLPDRVRVLIEFLSARESHLQNLILLVLDYKRSVEGEAALIVDTVKFYRNAIQQQLNLANTEQASLLFSIIVGHLIHKLMDASIRLGSIEPAIYQVISNNPTKGRTKGDR